MLTVADFPDFCNILYRNQWHLNLFTLNTIFKLIATFKDAFFVVVVADENNYHFNPSHSNLALINDSFNLSVLAVYHGIDPFSANVTITAPH